MSFLTQMVASDQIYQQQQKEREDRAFELLKRQHEQAEMEKEAYLMPFETKELAAQYGDSARNRQNAQEQEALNKWVVPFESKLGANEDGTRQMDVRVPFSPAMAGIAAAGLGTLGNNVEDFVAPFADQAVVHSRQYQTPEEILQKASIEDEHKKALELAAARKSIPRAATPSKQSIPGIPGVKTSNTKTSGANIPAATGAHRADKRYNSTYKQFLDYSVNKMLETSGPGAELTPEQMAIAAQKADSLTAAALGYHPDPASGQSGAPATPQPTPGVTPAAPGDDPLLDELEQIVDPPTTTVGLQDKQASTAQPDPVIPFQPGSLSPAATPLAAEPGFIEKYTRLKPDSWLMDLTKLFKVSKNPPKTPKVRSGNTGGLYEGFGAYPDRSL